MEILYRADNLYGSRYIVQVPPARQLMFLIRGGDAVDLPMPWLIYVIITTSGDLNISQKATSLATSIFGRSSPVKSRNDTLHALPLPDMYDRWCYLSYCRSYRGTYEPDLPEEELIAWGINESWSSPFAYIMTPGKWGNYEQKMNDQLINDRHKQLSWLGITNIELDMRMLVDLGRYYERWEKLSLSYATRMPWGQAPCGSINELISLNPHINWKEVHGR
ncbi:MAG TPA: hypothetical protein VJ742_13410 [Nitrososphaera sp.]|nr:hypothetical protein [Nitrososphaera sp.]